MSILRLRHIAPTLLVFVISILPLYAQRFEFPVSVDNKTLRYPFAGGVNAPQFFLADIVVSTPTMELIWHDRSGGTTRLFSYEYINNAPELCWLDSIHLDLPQAAWIDFIDYNLDGVIDAFAQSQSGIQAIDVYRGRLLNGIVRFEYIKQTADPFGTISYANEGAQRFPIYVADVDYPLIRDVDGDGDIDVLSFEPEGTFIFYYRNMAIERGLPLDSLEYILADRCWGKFAESFENNNVDLGDSPDKCGFGRGKTVRSVLHAGSAISGLDFDLDGDLDIVLGDIGAQNLVFLPNAGTPDLAFMDTFFTRFPFSNEPVEIDIFPNAFYLPFEGNNIHIVAASNDEDAIPEAQQIWRYEGSSSNASNFTLAQKNWFISDMLDFGIDAFPIIYDANNDGLNDLIIASRFHDGYQIDRLSQIFVFQQTAGKLEHSKQHSFDQLDADLNGPNGMVLHITDLTGDENEDLIVGLQNGRLAYAVGNDLGNFNWTEVLEDAWNIDVGSTAHPATIDANNDGMLDLVIGERNGNLNLYLNQGTPNSPVFNQVADDFWLRIDARQGKSVVGLAAPILFNYEGKEFLTLGTEIGNLLTYQLNRDANGMIVEAIENDILKVSNLNIGKRTKPFLGDLDHNGFYELWIGNARGGVEVFETQIRSEVTTSTITESNKVPSIQVYPNPTMHFLNIESDLSHFTFEIWDINGRKLIGSEANQSKENIDITKLINGTYWIKISNGEYQAILSFIKI